jgi:hypothetical protein
VIALDGDVTVKTHFAKTLLSFSKLFPDTIISGYNTKNHPTKAVYSTYCTKNTIEGVSMVMNEKVFRMYAEPALKKGNGWQQSMCRLMAIYDKDFIVVSPSVVQCGGEAFDYNGN